MGSGGAQRHRGPCFEPLRAAGIAILRAKMIVVNRKVGNQVFYSIRDPALIEVLDILRRYFYSQLSNTVNMLEEAGQTR